LSLALIAWPDNGGTMPSENHAFTTRVDPVSPPFDAGPRIAASPRTGETGGGAGYCPRVRAAYST